MTERYTPGHTDDAVRFMARRTIESHGAFFVPHIPRKGEILDCGCGPGTITCDLAERAPAARVVGSVGEFWTTPFCRLSPYRAGSGGISK